MIQKRKKLTTKKKTRVNRVLIIGAGQEVVPLIELLSAVDDVLLVGVCGMSAEAPGLLFARKRKIPTTTQIAKFIKNNDLDVIVEASGSKVFQAVLLKLVDKKTQVIDSRSMNVLLAVAQKTNAQERKKEFAFIKGLSGLFSVDFDSGNIVIKLYEILKDLFSVDVVALLRFSGPQNQLVLASECGVTPSVEKQFLEYFKKDSLTREFVQDKNISVMPLVYKKGKKLQQKAKTMLAYPLETRGGMVGCFFVASRNESLLMNEASLMFDLVARELALFLENEGIKQELLESKNRFSSMMQSMTEGVLCFNEKQEVVLVNKAAQNLLNLGVVRIGGVLAESTQDYTLISFLGTILSCEEGSVVEKDFGFEKEVKTYKFCHSHVVNSLGEMIGHIILINDITKEKKVDKMKSEFVSTTSHELRTPLAAIKESVALVADRTAGDITQNQDRFLGIAMRNLDRLATLINNLLDLSKLDTGKMSLAKEFCDINDLIFQVVAALDLLARKKEIQIKTSVATEAALLFCDVMRLQQIVINLVGNAIKFTPKKGTISIKISVQNKTAEPGTKEALFSIEDTGPGMKEKDAANIFERFQQVDGSLTRRHAGTGLGLSISKELVVMHGGKIWAETRLGKGTKIKFTIPLQVEKN
jgi:signal transduction histidine kinase